MRRALEVFDRAVRALCALGAWVAAALVLVSLALIAYSVAMRYFVGRPQSWVDEIVGYLLVGFVMLAAADALRRGEHIAVDVVTERLGPRGRRVTAAAGLAAVAAVAWFLVDQGREMVAFSRLVGLVSNSALAVPMAWPQLLVPAGAALLGLAALAGLARMALGRPAAEEEEPADAPGPAPRP